MRTTTAVRRGTCVSALALAAAALLALALATTG